MGDDIQFENVEASKDIFLFPSFRLPSFAPFLVCEKNKKRK